MSFAALCGSQGWNSLTSPFPGAPATSESISELFGCALVSSGGGLRSIIESLLELSPSSIESARTRSGILLRRRGIGSPARTLGPRRRAAQQKHKKQRSTTHSFILPSAAHGAVRLQTSPHGLQ